MAITSHRIISLPEFIAKVVEVRNRWRDEDIERAKRSDEDPDSGGPALWFRGQPNAVWELRPKLYRSGKTYDENEIRSEFRLRAVQLMAEPHAPKDDREWYFLMQHFGAPTRLLDWTDGALIALYFAVKERKRYRDTAVWMLDPNWLNRKVLDALDENNYVSGILLPHWKEAEAWFPEPFEQTLHVVYPVAKSLRNRLFDRQTGHSTTIWRTRCLKSGIYAKSGIVKPDCHTRSRRKRTEQGYAPLPSLAEPRSSWGSGKEPNCWV